MRLVWLSEQRQWENEQAHLADDLVMAESDDDRDTLNLEKDGLLIPNGPSSFLPVRFKSH
jgi:hypothetical protein